MIYINALNLINECVKQGILVEHSGYIYVYRNRTETTPPGWSLTEKDLLAKELMGDEEGQTVLIGALKEKGTDFKPFKI